MNRSLSRQVQCSQIVIFGEQKRRPSREISKREKRHSSVPHYPCFSIPVSEGMGIIGTTLFLSSFKKPPTSCFVVTVRNLVWRPLKMHACFCGFASLYAAWKFNPCNRPTSWVSWLRVKIGQLDPASPGLNFDRNSLTRCLSRVPLESVSPET